MAVAKGQEPAAVGVPVRVEASVLELAGVGAPVLVELEEPGLAWDWDSERVRVEWWEFDLLYCLLLYA